MVGIPGISATGDVRRTVQGVDNRERDNRYATLDLQGAFKLGSIEHDVLFGIDAELLDSVDPSFFRQPLVVGFNVFNPIYRVLQPPTTVTAANTFAWQRTQSEIDNASLFLQDSMRIGERWIVLLGLRYQESEQFATSRNLRLSVPVDVVTNNSKHDVVLPRVGVVYRPRSWLAWYANFSESFVPNVFNADIVGPLDPEEGVIYEIGSKLDLDNGIAATMAVFNIDRENILVNVGGVSRTAGKARSRGFEIDLSGKLSQSLDLSATYANTDAKTLRDQITTEGKRLQNSARNIGSVFLTYRAGSPDAGGQWSFGGGARYVGERPVDNVNTFLLDAYTVADVYAAYRWQTGAGLATVRLNVKNAFDKEHYTGAIGGVITDTGGGSIYLGAPRQILMQIGLEF